MDPFALAAVIGSCLAALLGGLATLLRFRPENRKMAADASATVVGAATDLVTAQAQELARLSARLDTLEAQAAEALQSRAALRREIDELREDLSTAIHERDESILREGILRKRVSRLEQELVNLKAPIPAPE